MTTLDRSGSIGIVTAAPQGGSYCQTVWWKNLSPFTQGYVEALFASIPNECRTYEGFAARGHRPIAFRDLSSQTLARIFEDCEWLCTDAPDRRANVEAGAEAWAVRQAGQMAHVEPLTVVLGDDGQVRFA